MGPGVPPVAPGHGHAHHHHPNPFAAAPVPAPAPPAPAPPVANVFGGLFNAVPPPLPAQAGPGMFNFNFNAPPFAPGNVAQPAPAHATGPGEFDDMPPLEGASLDAQMFRNKN